MAYTHGRPRSLCASASDGRSRDYNCFGALFPSPPNSIGLSLHPTGSHKSLAPMEFVGRRWKTNKSDRMCFSRLTPCQFLTPLPLDQHAPYLNLNLWARLLLPRHGGCVTRAIKRPLFVPTSINSVSCDFAPIVRLPNVEEVHVVATTKSSI